MPDETIRLLSDGKTVNFMSVNNSDNPAETQNLGISDAVSTESRSLARVISCYLEGKHLLTPRLELIQQIGLMIVAFSGAGIYAVAADKYSLSIGYSSWVMRASFIGCTCFTALVVLYNSTDMFFNQQHAERIPVELTGILNQLRTVTRQRLKNLGIVIAAAISALPLALLSFTYPIPFVALPGQIVLAIVVEIDNTVLHFLPIDLALQHKPYRIPFLPFEYAYKLITYFRLTVQERENRQSKREEELIFSSIKQRLIGQLTLFQQRVAIYGFSFHKSKCSYEKLLPRELYFNYIDQDTYSYLESLLSFHHNPYPESKSNASNFLRGKLNTFLRFIAYMLGAVWMVMGTSGYLAAPINALNLLLENSTISFNETSISPVFIASIASAPSVYFFGILIAYLGGNALRDTYDYFVSWGDDDVKVPLQFKLCPKIFTLLIAFSVYVFNFCYASAVQLALDNFAGPVWVTWLPIAFWSARTGLVFLSMSAMFDFYRKTIDKIVLHCTRIDNHGLVRLHVTIEQLKAGITLMSNEEFLESLSSLSLKHLHLFLSLRSPQESRALEIQLRSLVSLYFKDTYMKEVTMQLLRKVVSM